VVKVLNRGSLAAAVDIQTFIREKHHESIASLETF